MIKNLFIKYKEIILYLVFGVLTTVVNIVSFYFCFNLLKINWEISNIIAWISSVLFAYITNKLYVFSKSGKNIIQEILSFFGVRLLSFVMDMLMMYLLIDVFQIDNLISKIIVNVFVIIINYIFSKFLVFNKYK